MDSFVAFVVIAAIVAVVAIVTIVAIVIMGSVFELVAVEEVLVKKSAKV